MGWTFRHATEYKNGKVNRKAECDKNYTWSNETMNVSVVKLVMVGTEYFAAIKCIEDGNETVEAVMCLTAGQDRRDPWYNFGDKSIPHTDSNHCPMSIIKLLSPSDDEKEMKWRRDCEEYAKKPKLKDLPVGTIITYTWWNGEKYELEKMAPNYQFRKTWWYRAANNKYVPSRHIPDSWEVIK